MVLEDKLYTVKYNPDTVSHLNPDNEICKTCSNKPCTYICPANVYEWNSKKSSMTIRYENCLECGACKIACDKQNIIWRYPNAEYGVKYKNG